ncbi:MAG: ribosome biogenesis GTPase Der [Alphaproteobacteria bacterium GM7ARS4]|nr:ribosome biogenesis GTPase Der [Alphaproteobacteria bacterium GM7ARS4]
MIQQEGHHTIPSFHIALIGRANVGKSTLFNRFIGSKDAITHAHAGTTHDRRYGTIHKGNARFVFCDSPGYHARDTERLFAQSRHAFEECDLALLVVDGREPLHPDDDTLAKDLRRDRKKILVVVNKCEGRHGQDTQQDAWRLGLGEAIPVSALNGEGIDRLYDHMAQCLDIPPEEEREEECDEECDEEKTPPSTHDKNQRHHRHTIEKQDVISFALIGRPNVGKSTLANGILQEERMLTGTTPGLTRDAISLPFTRGTQAYCLIDTAGIRRRHEKRHSIEAYSVYDSYQAIKRAHAVILITDIRDAPCHQDLALAHDIEQQGRPLILALNKGDLRGFSSAHCALWHAQKERGLSSLASAQMIPISAKTGRNVHALFTAMHRAHDHWHRHIPTAPLNRWLGHAQDEHPIPLKHGKRPKIRYMTQTGQCPPQFRLFSPRPQDIPPHYRKYLLRRLKRHFHLDFTPIQLHFVT